ncbi:MAG: DNA alkylation repair protein [Verrucomicrobiae bacterium]|nr:DNA alkylation repair protein [Verrucomicrobiae bacterium]
MNLNEVMGELAARGNETTKRTYIRHGAVEPLFGVRIGDLKLLQRKLKGRHEVALELYATGNFDAMYLAGLVADGRKMTVKQLDQWAKGATAPMIAGFTIPGVAAEHHKAVGIATKWIDSKMELVATAGWTTLAAVASTVPDEHLPLAQLASLLNRCSETIASADNRVRYAMNGYVIACGTYVRELGNAAVETARKVSPVHVDMGPTACKVPDAESYIIKSRRGKTVAPKKKSTRC